MIDREQAIEVVLRADVRGSGPLELVRREAEFIVDAILALPDPLFEELRATIRVLSVARIPDHADPVHEAAREVVGLPWEGAEFIEALDALDAALNRGER